MPDYSGKDLPVRRGQDNFDTIEYQYYGDTSVALEAFKANPYDFRLENSAKNWATAYDFPAMTEGKAVKKLVALDRPIRRRASLSICADRNSRTCAFAAPSIWRSISNGRIKISFSGNTPGTLATSKARSWLPRVNGCRFCATSHFFGKAYTPFFQTGAELFRTACRIAEDLGADDFFVMDENFFKQEARARELLALMEHHRRPFRFGLFSSAEAIESFGVENMVRLGVDFVWLGAESKRETYAKNQGRDLPGLIRRLRDYGIPVLASGILFLDHHTPENIQEDIDFMVGLEADMTQFMMFTAMPVTALYQDLKARGLLDLDLPYEEWHGQHTLNWRHPRFSSPEARRLLADAFRRVPTAIPPPSCAWPRPRCAGSPPWKGPTRTDPWLAIRRTQLRDHAQRLRLLLPTLRCFAHNPLERERVAELGRAFQKVLGPMPLGSRALSLAGLAVAGVQTLRAALWSRMAQPSARLTRYRWPGPAAGLGAWLRKAVPHGCTRDSCPSRPDANNSVSHPSGDVA